ncbi:uncharacterized protein DSM5745_10847 [Aspergillus mulundensis]|uniref:Large ribosomal subunit protein mL50 n=1 Tax=Aspergillus mulundensis TaxID=1810919 RepID=A0A3D8QEY6_9EURO|nr:Uncharacterized protein DSM5745_10847 [Aspergillus mulundensis]RDW60389.1 Uncharacterized protein DSM5745_10847 [Aspergillus mulundensis]
MASPIPRSIRQVLQKSPSDIVILSSLRTPVTRAKKGGFKDAYPEELLANVLRATLEANPNLDPALIEDVCIGSVLQELGGAKAGRMAQIHAGFPHTVPFHTINRQCSSGLAAISTIGNSIRAGALNVGVGGGMESMTRNYGSRAIPTVLWPELKESPSKDSRDCIMPMGITSENVASRYGISREDQDVFAANSHKKAAAAQEAGLFDSEIVPVKTLSYDAQNPDTPPTEITVTKDDGVRANISVEKMASLKPAFSATGSSTAGNSSQVSDGAAAALLMRRSTATELGLTSSIKARWVGTAVAGCAPDEMGVGPAVAIPKLLQMLDVNVSDVGIWELNEAFASQALYCARKLGIDEAKINPKGGAIAIGHPLGATGARQLATLLPELERTGQEVGVISMCIGTGMGMAGIVASNRQDLNIATMRSSMRLLNVEVATHLQGSRTRYVCSTCRQEARPRPFVARQFLRHASDNNTPITERVRRKLWGTDNPPGLKDPYGGEGVFEKKFGKGSLAQKQGGAPGSDEGAAENQAATAEGGDVAEEAIDGEYLPATTWEGLDRIGHLGRWNDLPPNPEDAFTSFSSNRRLTKPGHLALAAHQTAVELCIMRTLNKPLASICEVVEHEKPVFKLIYNCKIQPNSAWDSALEYPDKETEDALVFIFKQIGAQDAEQTAEASGNAASEEYEDAPAVKKPFFFGYQDVKDKGFSTLSLSDPATKFAFLKRFSQLSGHYFPDPTIESITSVKQVLGHILKETAPKPKKLAEYLLANDTLQTLPNVKIFAKRQKPWHKDEELGRKKLIDRELRRRGLVE